MSNLDWLRKKDDDQSRREDPGLRAAREQVTRDGKETFNLARLARFPGMAVNRVANGKVVDEVQRLGFSLVPPCAAERRL